MSTLSVLTEVIQSLTKIIWKPKQYVDLTAAKESGSAKGPEYDIIIIGGGMYHLRNLSLYKWDQVAECSALLVRNGWLCACFSSFRELEYSCAPTWIRRKVCIWLFILLDNGLLILSHSSALSGRALSESRIPCAYFQLFPKKEHVLPFYTDPQTSANSKAKFWPRGMYNARPFLSTAYTVFFLKEEC